jgi:hypothetical protein
MRCIALCSTLPTLTVQRSLRLCQSKFSSRMTARNSFGSIRAFLAISMAVILAAFVKAHFSVRARPGSRPPDGLPVFIGPRPFETFKASFMVCLFRPSDFGRVCYSSGSCLGSSGGLSSACYASPDALSHGLSDYVGGKEPSPCILSGQEFDDAEPVLLMLPVGLEIIFLRRSQDRRSPCSAVLIQNSRYTDDTENLSSFVFPYCHLQGITVRPVPCNYNVIQSVSALSLRYLLNPRFSTHDSRVSHDFSST